MQSVVLRALDITAEARIVLHDGEKNVHTELESINTWWARKWRGVRMADTSLYKSVGSDRSRVTSPPPKSFAETLRARVAFPTGPNLNGWKHKIRSRINVCPVNVGHVVVRRFFFLVRPRTRKCSRNDRVVRDNVHVPWDF